MRSASFILSSAIWIALASAFAPPSTLTKRSLTSKISKLHKNQSAHQLTIIYAGPGNDDDLETTDQNIEPIQQFRQETPSETETESILQRFLSPKIDDPGLPLTDVLLAQIVAPSFQTFWIFAAHAPTPSWLRPLGSYFGEAPELAPRGSLLAPVLIHGAGLAVCWLAGALAARFYEEDSFTLKEVESNSLLDRIGSYKPVGEHHFISSHMILPFTYAYLTHVYFSQYPASSKPEHLPQAFLY